MVTPYLYAILVLLLSYQAVAQKCGFESCTPFDPNVLNVHIVSHTHDDVGWLKTVDQYYYGSHSEIQQAGVQYILNSVIEELQKNPDRKFTYVEMAFFYRWWMQQDEGTRTLVRQLVDNGQLHFTVGGWSMADEATTHYVSLIDQHTFGFRFLSDTFGECGRPLAAWQIDPFGHSREVANLFAQFGFNGLYLGRIDYQDKIDRSAAQQMEFVWKGSDDFDAAKNIAVGTGRFGGINELLQATTTSGEHDIFTGITYYGYSPPVDFCWDQWCGDDPIMDDLRLHDYNVDTRVSEFVTTVKNWAKSYNSNNLMLTMGNDFNWQNANKWFVNLDKLIKYVNQKTNETGVRAFYSTPDCYTHSVNQAKKTYKVKSDDFFPYADKPHGFWTGYFTSRPALKGFVRETESYLQSFRQLHMLALLGDASNTSVSLFTLSEALGLAQHHDAVSGTEKQLVAYDYAQRLQAGLDACEQTILNSAYARLMPRESASATIYAAPIQSMCAYLNVSVCAASVLKQPLTVTAYNPYGQATKVWLRLPVSGQGAVTVTSPTGNAVATQLVPITNSTRAIWTYMVNGHVPVTAADNELVFTADLPALGWSTYFVSPASAAQKPEQPKLQSNMKRHRVTSIPNDPIGKFSKLAARGKKTFIIKNEHLALHFDTQSGLLTQLDNLDIAKSFPLEASLKYYIAMDTSGVNVPSGAYIFRPFNGTFMEFGVPTVSYVQGDQVQEVWQTFGSSASLVTRLYADANYVELEWTVGPINVEDKWGKEVILLYKTALDNGGVCWTDANGRQLLKRVRNYRPTWNLTQTENISGNYYPINSRIAIRDSQAQNQLTVLTDRSAGGGCIQDGTIEVMLHRRLLHDDYLGVGEFLNESGLDGNGLIVRGKHFLIFDTVEHSAALHRDLAMRTFCKPLVTFSPNAFDYATYVERYRTQYTGLMQALPPNVHLLSFSYWRNVSSNMIQALLRFEHFYQRNEDPKLSQPATFRLQDLFANVTMTALDTLTLGANQKASDAQRLTWNIENEGVKTDWSMFKRQRPLKYQPEELNVDDDWQITLQPMEIRTIVVNITLN